MYILQDYDKNLKRILEEGMRKPNRTGVDTLSLFGLQGRYRIDQYFPLPTKRKYAYKSIFAELLWMLSGSTNVKDLEAMGSKIWSAWKDQKFEEANQYQEGELGPIYGWQMRHFGGDYNLRHSSSGPGGVDQIAFVVKELQENKYSRRIMINLWNPPDVLFRGVRLPPCHYSFQLLVDDKDRLTGILTQRSGDWLPGVAANIFFYAALIYMLAQQCGLTPYELVHNVSDSHVYLDKISMAQEYLARPEIDAPKLILHPAKDIFSYTLDSFEITGYNPLPSIKIPVAVWKWNTMNKRTLTTLINTASDLVANKIKKSKKAAKKEKTAPAVAENATPNRVLNVGEPQYIGEFPTRQDMEVVPLEKAGQKSLGQQEWDANKSLMITLYGVGGQITNPTGIHSGDWILVRSVEGGFYGPVRTIKTQSGKLGAWVMTNKKTLVDVSYSSKLRYWITTTKV